MEINDWKFGDDWCVNAEPFPPSTFGWIVARVPAIHHRRIGLSAAFAKGIIFRSGTTRRQRICIVCQSLPTTSPPPAPRLPPLVVKLTRTRPMLLHLSGPDRFAPRLNGRSANAEIVPIIKTATCHADGVGASALVALPDPFERRGWAHGVIWNGIVSSPVLRWIGAPCERRAWGERRSWNG